MNMQFVHPATRWSKHITKALRRCNMKIDVSEILNQLYNKELLFAESKCGKAFVILQLNTIAPFTYVVHIYLMGGDKHAMLDLEKFVVDYARSINAVKVTAIVRKGFWASKWWHKNTEGWKSPCDWIEKEL